MAHTITARLNKPAREFQAGENIGFNIRFGERYYDRKAGKNEWTNYSAVVFAKEGKQADYYRNVLIEGAIVEVSSESLRIDIYDGQNGQSITLDMVNARIGFASSGQPTANQSAHTPPFDDSIPF